MNKVAEGEPAVKLAISQPVYFGFERRHHASEPVRDRARMYRRRGATHARLWKKTRRRSVRAKHSLRDHGYKLSKRTFDFLFAASLLLVSSPFLLLIAVAIKMTDGGPVLFWQRRVGQFGEIFNFPKFRSMIMDADKIVDTLAAHNHHGDSITFKIKRDPRVTRVGQLLRRFSLDEVPQLWCVLTGQMSLVGPRPALPREVQWYSQQQRRRLHVRPGLTCIWQVSGRADVPFAQQVQMDIDYVENHNFLLDLRLVAATVPAVITGRGAY